MSATYDEQVETSVQRFTALLEPMLILLMVGVVLIIILATLVPLLELGTQAGAAPGAPPLGEQRAGPRRELDELVEQRDAVGLGDDFRVNLLRQAPSAGHQPDDLTDHVIGGEAVGMKADGP